MESVGQFVERIADLDYLPVNGVRPDHGDKARPCAPMPWM